MPFLSVIVPIYGVEQYLHECVDSIIEQTFEDIEIILVDDGSKDSCPSICDFYASKDKRIHVIHKKNGGLVSARKAGVQVAKGEYITFVDGDDSIEKDMYRDLCLILKETEADIVAEGIQFSYLDKTVIGEDKVEQGLYNKQQLQEKVYPVMMCHAGRMSRNVAPSMCNKLFRKELIYSVVMNMNENIKDGEDASVTYPCFLQAENVFFNTKGHHYKYRINEVSMSRSYDPKWSQNASDYCEWIEKHILCLDVTLKESVFLEQFRMLYRYLDKEYVFCKENGISFTKSIKNILEDTVVGKSLYKVQIDELKLSYIEKIQYNALKRHWFWCCEILCWCRRMYIKLMHK